MSIFKLYLIILLLNYKTLCLLYQFCLKNLIKTYLLNLCLNFTKNFFVFNKYKNINLYEDIDKPEFNL